MVGKAQMVSQRGGRVPRQKRLANPKGKLKDGSKLQNTALDYTALVISAAGGFPSVGDFEPEGAVSANLVCSWLILCFSAYIIAHWTYLSTQFPNLPDWGEAAQTARELLFSQTVVSLLLQDIEHLSSIARLLWF